MSTLLKTVIAGCIIAINLQQVHSAKNDSKDFHWTRMAPADFAMLRAVAWADSQFVAVGDSGVVLTSKDGNTWIRRDSKTSRSLRQVAAHSGKLVVLGDSGAVIISGDGINWAAATTNIPDIQGLTWSGKSFLGVQSKPNYTLIKSNDGIAWDTVSNINVLLGMIPKDGYHSYTSVAIQCISEKVLVAYDNFVCISHDSGHSWQINKPLGEGGDNGFSFSCFCWNGNELVMGGRFGGDGPYPIELFSSDTGKTWTQMSPTIGSVYGGVSSIAWTGSRFVTGGEPISIYSHTGMLLKDTSVYPDEFLGITSNAAMTVVVGNAIYSCPNALFDALHVQNQPMASLRRHAAEMTITDGGSMVIKNVTADIAGLHLLSIAGKTLYSERVQTPASELTLSIKMLPAGMYLLKMDRKAAMSDSWTFTWSGHR